MSDHNESQNFVSSYLQALQQAFESSQHRDGPSQEEAIPGSSQPPLGRVSHACDHVLEDGRQCSNRGKLSHDGRWFCGHHHPDVLQERRSRREAQWAARLRPLPVGQARLEPQQLQDLGLPLLSCSSCQRPVVAQLEKMVRALEPYERDGKLPIPGLESLLEARDVLARARNGLLAKPSVARQDAPSQREAENFRE